MVIRFSYMICPSITLVEVLGTFADLSGGRLPRLAGAVIASGCLSGVTRSMERGPEYEL